MFQNQIALFEAPVFLKPETTPGGFFYQENFLTTEEEQHLLETFKSLPFKNDNYNGYTARRRIIGYGWESRPEIPDFIHPLVTRAEQLLNLKPQSLNTALISEYAPGTPIGWHRDKPTIGHVVGISLCSPCQFRLRKVSYNIPTIKWERFSVQAEPRSVYCMREESRRDWQHSIAPVEALRYSITLRDF
jgi:alkylated DNA repair dioxygenase AlkB